MARAFAFWDLAWVNLPKLGVIHRFWPPEHDREDHCSTRLRRNHVALADSQALQL